MSDLDQRMDPLMRSETRNHQSIQSQRKRGFDRVEELHLDGLRESVEPKQDRNEIKRMKKKSESEARTHRERLRGRREIEDRMRIKRRGKS